jgi:TetR/AcrR family transcriptional regulator, repressor of fatR-cypB operon
MNILSMPKKKTDKREAILDAMLDLVVTRGLEDAPMSVLAKKSGASPGVIYHYFAGKEELIHAVHERAISIKHEVFFEGVSLQESPHDALIQMWLNAYRFYRTHRKEARFLDQYLNSSYCKSGDKEDDSDETARILQWLKPKKKGGLLKDLPPEAIESLTLGLAASLAKSPKVYPRATLLNIAETVWAAISDL